MFSPELLSLSIQQYIILFRLSPSARSRSHSTDSITEVASLCSALFIRCCRTNQGDVLHFQINSHHIVATCDPSVFCFAHVFDKPHLPSSFRPNR